MVRHADSPQGVVQRAMQGDHAFGSGLAGARGVQNRMHRLGHQLRLEAVGSPARRVRLVRWLPRASEPRRVESAERRLVACVRPILWLFGADSIRTCVQHLQVLAD
jgi:hypothetical protein